LLESLPGGGRALCRRVRCLCTTTNVRVRYVSIHQGDQFREESPGDVGRLVQAALRGDLGAFDRLVARFQRQATAVAYRLLNNRDDAMEVTQDAFLKAYEKLDSLSNPGQFGAWLMRIVSNLSLNRRRARALRRAVSLDRSVEDDERKEWNLPDLHSPSPADVASGKELKGKIADAVQQLPERQRQALVLFSIAELPQKEVARQLGCSVQAVKWHVFAARKKLKETLKDYL